MSDPHTPQALTCLSGHLISRKKIFKRPLELTHYEEISVS